MNMIEMIVAADLNFGIGNENKLLTKLKDDLKFFKEITNNKTIIMGRKTFESLPFKLPNRKHVIISRNKNYMCDDNDLTIFTSLELAIELNPDSIIIGGGEIYKESLNKNIVDVIYLTLILNRYSADTFLTKIPENFNLVNSKSYSKNENNEENFIINKFIKH
jgi:dihydrofolate reductase